MFLKSGIRRAVKPTRDEIRAWLKQAKGRRAWLAKQCGAETKTVSNWLSGQDIPDATHLLIGRIMDESGASDGGGPPSLPTGHAAIYLSGEALRRADAASRIAKSNSLAEFCVEAIRVRADELLRLQALPDEIPEEEKAN